MHDLTRRSVAGAVTALGYSRILGANDRVGIGYIGLGNREIPDTFEVLWQFDGTLMVWNGTPSPSASRTILPPTGGSNTSTGRPTS